MRFSTLSPDESNLFELGDIYDAFGSIPKAIQDRFDWTVDVFCENRCIGNLADVRDQCIEKCNDLVDPIPETCFRETAYKYITEIGIYGYINDSTIYANHYSRWTPVAETLYHIVRTTQRDIDGYVPRSYRSTFNETIHNHSRGSVGFVKDALPFLKYYRAQGRKFTDSFEECMNAKLKKLI